MTAFSVTEALVGHIGGLGFRASTRVPADMPDTFVTVERVGGGVADWIDHAAMAVQVWSRSDAQAEEAANSLRLALLAGDPPTGVYAIRVEAGPYQFYDEDTRRPRYQMVLDVTCQLSR